MFGGQIAEIVDASSREEKYNNSKSKLLIQKSQSDLFPGIIASTLNSPIFSCTLIG